MILPMRVPMRVPCILGILIHVTFWPLATCKLGDSDSHVCNTCKAYVQRKPARGSIQQPTRLDAVLQISHARDPACHHLWRKATSYYNTSIQKNLCFAIEHSFPSHAAQSQTRTSDPQSSSALFSQPPATMANFLASIFGTELDKVNCSFYFVSFAMPCCHFSLEIRARNKETRTIIADTPPRKSVPAATATAAPANTSSHHTRKRSSCPTCTRTQHTTPTTR